MNFIKNYLSEAVQIINSLNTDKIEEMIEYILRTKQIGGRIFFLGVGGSAGNCSHAVNDFRKLVGIESYAPTDNVSEITARTNDEGWETIFVEWLKVSKLSKNDLVFVFSVGGGDIEKNVSPNLVHALMYSKKIGTPIVGIVGRNGGYTAKVADSCLVIPSFNADNVTPHSEAFQSVIWHLLVSHPLLKQNSTKWESLVRN